MAPGLMYALEQAVLEPPHQRLGAEDADRTRYIGVEDEREDGQAGQRLAHQPPEAFLHARRRPAAHAPVLDGHVVRPRGRGRRGRAASNDGTAASAKARSRSSARPRPFGGHRLDHRNAQPRRQPGRVDDDAVRARFVRHVQHEHHRPARSAASWEVSISPRRRFRASATWMTTSTSSPARMRRETTSSSLSDAVEGVDAGRVDDVADLAADQGPALGDGDRWSRDSWRRRRTGRSGGRTGRSCRRWGCRPARCGAGGRGGRSRGRPPRSRTRPAGRTSGACRIGAR